jgi:hypothetical protein
MSTVVAVVVRGRRVFSGSAAARVVGAVGGRCDRPPRPFGYRAAMIAHARATGRFGAVGPACQWQMQPPAVNAHGVWFVEHCSLRSINPRKGGSPLPHHLALPPFASCLHFPAARPFIFAHHSLRLRALPPTAMAPPQPIVVLDPLPWSRSTVTTFALNELVNGGQLVSNVEGSCKCNQAL